MSGAAAHHTTSPRRFTRAAIPPLPLIASLLVAVVTCEQSMVSFPVPPKTARRVPAALATKAFESVSAFVPFASRIVSGKVIVIETMRVEAMLGSTWTP